MTHSSGRHRQQFSPGLLLVTAMPCKASALRCAALCVCAVLLAACTARQVEVMWVVNQRQSKWESALPKETADLLDSVRGQQSGTLGSIANQVAGAINEQLGTGEHLMLGW